jgi:hypothetical protein
MRAKLLAVVATSAVIVLGAAPTAGAATEIGSTFDPGTSSCGNLLLQSVSPPADPYGAPAAGVITSWSYQANASEIPVQLQLKVGRAAGTNQFTIVGESTVETASSLPLNSFLTRIPVQAGDLIGLRPVTIGLPCIRGMSPGYSYSAYVMGNDLAPGTTATFNPPVPTVQIDIAANLEPDGDGDGFGDETQDRCLGVPGPMDGCPSNLFTFGKLKRNTDRGTAVLTINVPNPGELTAAGKGVAGTAGISKAVAAGSASLLIRATGKKKRKLNDTGKVKLNAKISYTPTGGTANTQSRKVKLKKKL